MICKIKLVIVNFFICFLSFFEEEMLNPEAIEDNSYTMKAKCESLMRFVNKIEAYNVKY